MKLNPKNLFRSKKTIKVSRSDTSSFDSSITTSSDSPESTHRHKSKSNGSATPTSVLPPDPREISSDNPNNLCTVSRSESSSFDSLITDSKSKSNGISSDDVQYELIEAFRLIDTDGDGKITRSELESLLNRIGGDEPITPEEVTLMINEIDQDGDGSISLSEFGVISSAFGPPSCDDEIRGAFEFFDADHDGLITADELLAVFQSFGDGRCTLEECRRMISSVGKNGDGFVCFEDFARMMEPQRYRERETDILYC